MNLEENQNNDVFVVNGVVNYSFVKESITKIAIFSFLFSVFYPIGYFYKQWKAIKKNNENYKNISPFWRGVFYPIYMFPFTKIVKSLIENKEEITLKSVTFTEEQKADLQRQYKTLKSLTPLPYFILLALLICVIVFVSPIEFSTHVGTVIFALVTGALTYLQKAIDKFLPESHPKGKAVTFGDFLCIPVLIVTFILAIILSVIFAPNCFKTEGNVLENTCRNYSLTFPLKEEIQTTKYYHCQGNEESSICIGEMGRENTNEPELTLDQLAAEEYNPVLDKFTKRYANHTTHCFKEKDEKGYFYQCYMKIEEIPGLYLGFLATENNFENLEKLMNSYNTFK